MTICLFDECSDGAVAVWEYRDGATARAALCDRIDLLRGEGWTLFSFVRHADRAIFTRGDGARRELSLYAAEDE